jgi:HD-GYP domain-containing protein (c-di-GMP phosphodiesterase class II)
LSEAEFEVMKQHSRLGVDVATKAKLSEVVRHIVHYHHEYYDGNGYPAGLKGEEIPLAARIVAVADVFDALTSERSYRSNYPRERAIEIIETMSGKILDPHLVRIFLEILEQRPEFPIQDSGRE